MLQTPAEVIGVSSRITHTRRRVAHHADPSIRKTVYTFKGPECDDDDDGNDLEAAAAAAPAAEEEEVVPCLAGCGSRWRVVAL